MLSEQLEVLLDIHTLVQGKHYTNIQGKLFTKNRVSKWDKIQNLEMIDNQNMLAARLAT